MIGEQLKALRQRRNMTLGDVESKTKLDKGTVCKWENDHSSPRVENLVRLLEALGASFRDLKMPKRKKRAKGVS